MGFFIECVFAWMSDDLCTRLCMDLVLLRSKVKVSSLKVYR